VEGSPPRPRLLRHVLHNDLFCDSVLISSYAFFPLWYFSQRSNTMNPSILHRETLGMSNSRPLQSILRLNTLISEDMSGVWFAPIANVHPSHSASIVPISPGVPLALLYCMSIGTSNGGEYCICAAHPPSPVPERGVLLLVHFLVAQTQQQQRRYHRIDCVKTKSLSLAMMNSLIELFTERGIQSIFFQCFCRR
jgi:hypothetical protein